MQIQVKAHFNKQTKDSKKELVQFYVSGEDEKRPELNQMTREVVELEIDGIDVTLTAEFKKSAKDSKKTILDFEVKGDASAAHTFQFYKMAGADVLLTITESQMSIDEFREHQEEYREGVRGRINKDGTVEMDDDADEDQMTIDEVGDGDDAAGGEDDDLGDLEG